VHEIEHFDWHQTALTLTTIQSAFRLLHVKMLSARLF